MWLVLLYICGSLAPVAASWAAETLPICSEVQNTERNSFLWRLRWKNSSQHRYSYFYGTIHVPYSKVWDFVDPSVKTAFRNADCAVFELELTNPATLDALAKCQLLPNEEKLVDHLTPELYQRLKQYFELVRYLMPTWFHGEDAYRKAHADFLFQSITSNWERKRPIWIMLMINSLSKTDVVNRGVPVLDLFLAHQAISLSKATGAIERVDEQCTPLNSLNASEVSFAIGQALARQEALLKGAEGRRLSTEDLIYHYICGHLNEETFNRDAMQFPETLNGSTSYGEVSAARALEIDQYFRNELIRKRNQRMADRVSQLVQTTPNKTFFFAFGAGHFLGEGNILELVKKAGFYVEPVPANTYKDYAHFLELKTPSVPRHRDSPKYKNTHVYQWHPTRKAKKEQQLLWPHPATTQTTTQRTRQFKELWVRIEGFTQKPWENAWSDVAQHRQNYLPLEYRSSALASSSQALLSCTHILFLLCAQIHYLTAT